MNIDTYIPKHVKAAYEPKSLNPFFIAGLSSFIASLLANLLVQDKGIKSITVGFLAGIALFSTLYLIAIIIHNFYRRVISGAPKEYTRYSICKIINSTMLDDLLEMVEDIDYCTHRIGLFSAGVMQNYSYKIDVMLGFLEEYMVKDLISYQKNGDCYNSIEKDHIESILNCMLYVSGDNQRFTCSTQKLQERINSLAQKLSLTITESQL